MASNRQPFDIYQPDIEAQAPLSLLGTAQRVETGDTIQLSGIDSAVAPTIRLSFMLLTADGAGSMRATIGARQKPWSKNG